MVEINFIRKILTLHLQVGRKTRIFVIRSVSSLSAMMLTYLEPQLLGFTIINEYRASL